MLEHYDQDNGEVLLIFEALPTQRSNKGPVRRDDQYHCMIGIVFASVHT